MAGDLQQYVIIIIHNLNIQSFNSTQDEAVSSSTGNEQELTQLDRLVVITHSVQRDPQPSSGDSLQIVPEFRLRAVKAHL